MKSKNSFYEYGEISRKPISRNTLIKHYMKIYNGLAFKTSDFYYVHGLIVVPRLYHVKEIDGEYISKIRFYRFEM